MSSTSAIAASSEANMTPKQIVDAYNNDGLMVRTVQSKNLHFEFEGGAGSLDQIRDNAVINQTSPLSRNWSLIQKESTDMLYKMGPDVGSFPRSLGVIALPERTTNNILEVNDTDQSSNSRISDNQNSMDPTRADTEISKLKQTLIDRTKEGTMNQNSEIKTFGLLADAMVGFIHSGDIDTLKSDLIKIQNVLNGAGSEFDGRSFPVLKINTDSDGNSTFQEIDSLQRER